MSNPLVQNEITGFLESRSPNSGVTLYANHFDSPRKTQFLALIDEHIRLKRYPSLENIAESVGVCLRTFEKHLAIDKVFRDEWDERKLRLKSVFTVELANKAMSKMGTLANLAMLRYLESGTWLPETRVNHITDHSSSKSLISTIPAIIDGEIVANEGDIPSALPSQGDAHK